MWLRHQGLRSRRDKPSLLRDILADVPSQDFVDKSLISDAASTCFLAELIEHSRIDSNRDQLTRFIAETRFIGGLPATPPIQKC